MGWLQFVMDLGSLDPADVEDALLHLGACSVTLSDAGDDPVLEPGPGETPLWSRTRITGLFSDELDAASLPGLLQAELSVHELPAWCIEVLEDRAWEREWLKDFGPMRFGERLWICPAVQAGAAPYPEGTWAANSFGPEGPPTDAVVVHLDPGLAFGTGTHPTTALCLEWLDSIDLDGKTVLDYGCGSGVLGIAALKLGARAALGMDIDPQAVISTRQNAADNGVDMAVCGSDGEIGGRFDVVVANILAGPLVEFADCITSRLARGGMLALSGVLCEQAPEVLTAYDPWIEFDEPVFRELDGQTWSRLTGSRR
jgi:ribosomal protein L11 methyltransferase